MNVRQRGLQLSTTAIIIIISICSRAIIMSICCCCCHSPSFWVRINPLFPFSYRKTWRLGLSAPSSWSPFLHRKLPPSFRASFRRLRIALLTGLCVLFAEAGTSSQLHCDIALFVCITALGEELSFLRSSQLWSQLPNEQWKCANLAVKNTRFLTTL